MLNRQLLSLCLLLIRRLILTHSESLGIVKVELLSKNRNLNSWRLIIIIALLLKCLQRNANIIQMAHDFDNLFVLLFLLI